MIQVVEAEAGNLISGGIAVDDVQIFPGVCVAPTVPSCVFSCGDGSCLDDPKLICDFRENCADGSDEMTCGMFACSVVNITVGSCQMHCG